MAGWEVSRRVELAARAATVATLVHSDGMPWGHVECLARKASGDGACILSIYSAAAGVRKMIGRGRLTADAPLRVAVDGRLCSRFELEAEGVSGEALEIYFCAGAACGRDEPVQILAIDTVAAGVSSAVNLGGALSVSPLNGLELFVPPTASVGVSVGLVSTITAGGAGTRYIAPGCSWKLQTEAARDLWIVAASAVNVTVTSF